MMLNGDRRMVDHLFSFRIFGTVRKTLSANGVPAIVVLDTPYENHRYAIIDYRTEGVLDLLYFMPEHKLECGTRIAADRLESGREVMLITKCSRVLTS
jgi:hypothetical protein